MAATATDIPFSERKTIGAGLAAPVTVRAADLDGDGDLDVLGAANEEKKIYWWENKDSATTWTRHVVFPDFSDPVGICVADIDGDTDLDVIGTSTLLDTVAWMENTTGTATEWMRHDVGVGFDFPNSVYAADMDGDHDQDIVASAWKSNQVAWWENTNGLGTLWTKHSVDSYVPGAACAYPADVDGDGWMDVIGAAYAEHKVYWWRNADGKGTLWQERVISSYFHTAVWVCSADVDGDGDTDVLGAARYDDRIAWFENTNGLGTAWAQHAIDGNTKASNYVAGADLDGDGDIDVLAAAYNSNLIGWWENADGKGTLWIRRVIDGSWYTAWCAQAADLDGDGHLDVLGCARGAGEVAWWRNLSAQPLPPHLGEVSDNGDGSIHLTWTDAETSQSQFLAFAWDVYPGQWVGGGWNGTLWHPFPPEARSGEFSLTYTGAYHAWISSQYLTGNWLCCPNAWTGVLYSGVPHVPLGVWAQNRGQKRARLHWEPEIYGTWHYQIVAFEVATRQWTAVEGPSGNQLWHFVDWAGACYSPGSASFLDGWADFTVPAAGGYWFVIRGASWLPPYDPPLTGEDIVTFVDVTD